jgi:acetylornithine deacetylase/succinyl-diaminopimelate desuccinylase-like protein
VTSPLAQFLNSSRGQQLVQLVKKRTPAVIDEAIAIQQIAAPTFDEAARAAFVRDQFAALPGVDHVEVDALHNVYARLPGHDPTRPAIMVSAHTDTVFDADTDLTIQRTAERVTGPGIGDNSLAVAALLTLPDVLRDELLPSDVWLVANTREEGLGDLGGIRAVIDRLHSRLSQCIVLEGIAYGQIYHSGIAVRRLRISTHSAGGHSWLHYGQPSAIHSLVKIAARITDLHVPHVPRTSFNIGLIEGGRSVNSIASDASLTLDMRSEDAHALAALEREVRERCIGHVDCAVDIEVVGDRPGGSIPVTHPMVQWARQAVEATGAIPAYRAGSTDANWPLAHGIPALTIGITTGGNAHRMDEFIDLAPIGSGLLQLALLTMAVAGGVDSSLAI